MEITEDNMTEILKAFLIASQGKHFAYATFENGIVVFNFGTEQETKPRRESELETESNHGLDLLNPLNPASPISIFNDPVSTPDFGGFGGGDSGGGGTSGNW